MKPIHELDQVTQQRVLALIAAGEAVNLGNVAFRYYNEPQIGIVDYIASEARKGWELVINSRKGQDVYKIRNTEFVHHYSED